MVWYYCFYMNSEKNFRDTDLDYDEMFGDLTGPRVERIPKSKSGTGPKDRKRGHSHMVERRDITTLRQAELLKIYADLRIQDPTWRKSKTVPAAAPETTPEVTSWLDERKQEACHAIAEEMVAQSLQEAENNTA